MTLFAHDNPGWCALVAIQGFCDLGKGRDRLDGTSTAANNRNSFICKVHVRVPVGRVHDRPVKTLELPWYTRDTERSDTHKSRVTKRLDDPELSIQYTQPVCILA